MRKQCCSKKSYSEQFDSYFCPTCNIWLEDTCKDDNCYFCANRPEFPDMKKHNFIAKDCK